MKKNFCILCKNNKFILIWNDKLRSGRKSFTTNKEKIFKCLGCDLVFLKNRGKVLENSALARNLYNKDNSIKEFNRFHKPRELKKIKLLKKYVQFENKKILESNCGAGVLLSILKRKSKTTSGLDNKIYRNHLIENGHNHFSSLNEIIKKKKKFDLIFSLSELEHKYNPIDFLKKFKKILDRNGELIIRVPNFDNIYKIFLGNLFFKYDYRTSHNFYFSIKNLNLLFKKTRFQIKNIIGFQEYDINHLLQYIKTKKRVSGKYKKIFRKKIANYINENIEKNFKSTSLIYILKNK